VRGNSLTTPLLEFPVRSFLSPSQETQIRTFPSLFQEVKTGISSLESKKIHLKKAMSYLRKMKKSNLYNHNHDHVVVRRVLKTSTTHYHHQRSGFLLVAQQENSLSEPTSHNGERLESMELVELPSWSI